MTLIIPTTETAFENMQAVAVELRDAIKELAESYFACDDILEQHIEQLLGTMNAATGKEHSYTSAEKAVKNLAAWRDCRREAVRLEGQVEFLKARLEKATLMARLAVLQAEQQARAA